MRLIGDLPIYVAADGADHRAHPELFRAARSPACRPTPDAQRAAVGQPALRLAGACASRLPLVDRALAPDLRARSTSRASTTSAASSPTGRSRGRARRAGHGRWRRGPGARPLRRARERDARRAAADRRGPRRDHAAGRRLRDELGLPGMVVLQFGFGGTDRRNPHRPDEPSRALRRVHRHARHRHACGWWAGLSARDARGRAALDPDASRHWGLIELALLLAARRSRSCRRRTCSASAARRG